jgi:hypothetical protein
MGFMFSKTKKLTMKKEDARIRKLRLDYLKRCHEYDKLIEENNDRRTESFDGARPSRSS